ncbi:MAG: hypothetical protein Q7S27_05620 [Nanoarchaeota archaeon]|nr:hypothetical protein [Nanoarchaeota archaeon]
MGKDNKLLEKIVLILEGAVKKTTLEDIRCSREKKTQYEKNRRIYTEIETYTIPLNVKIENVNAEGLRLQLEKSHVNEKDSTGYRSDTRYLIRVLGGEILGELNIREAKGYFLELKEKHNSRGKF